MDGGHPYRPRGASYVGGSTRAMLHLVPSGMRPFGALYGRGFRDILAETGPFSPRTDLAVEARELVAGAAGEGIPGVLTTTETGPLATVTRVDVTTEEAERIMGKVRGRYVTLESPYLRSESRDIQEELSALMARELSGLVQLRPEATVLVVGLGNWNATPDALGPRVVSYLMITRHLYNLTPPEVRAGMKPVCAIAPGVLGITGIETGEIVLGVVEKVRPDLVIVVDALASRSTARVGTTIQIGNTGIHPGSGVGNRRFGITQQSLGVPVLAIGVPTVVDAITIASDAMEVMENTQRQVPRRGRAAARSEATSAAQSAAPSTVAPALPPAASSARPPMVPGQGRQLAISPDLKRDLIRQVLHPYLGSLIVTPKEIDSIVEQLARVVAGGINAALNPSIDLNKIAESLQ